jgi:hypothetical protein
MAVLGTDSAFVLDAFRPGDDERIVGAAFTVRILLPVLERSVCGLRPAERVISLVAADVPISPILFRL